MKILLTTLGTRGDAEPFLALGYYLREAGHTVRIALPEQLVPLAEDAGLAYTPFSADFLELLEGAAGRDIMGGRGGLVARGGQLFRLYRESQSVQRTLIREQATVVGDYRPDRIVTHPKCLYTRAFGLRHPGRVFVASPVPNAQHPSDQYPHIGVTRNLGPLGNRWSYALTNRVTAGMATRFLSTLPAGVPERTLTKRQLRTHFLRTEPWLYLISPVLFPKPAQWPDHAHLVGYHERPKAVHWSPSPELTRFLARYEQAGVTLITFGSMVNAAPGRVTGHILDALVKTATPALLVTSSGGLRPPDRLPDTVFAVEGIPYDWAFPRVHSIVHHGGSGTTHTALRYGRPSLVIPHIIDQFFWNRRVAELGAGPLGPGIKHLPSSDFGALLRPLRGDEEYARVARKIGGDMRVEAARMEGIIKLIAS